MSKRVLSSVRTTGENVRWMNSLVPYSVVSGTIGTLVQLYILDLGGSVLTVGLTITLYNAIAIPSAIFWGSVSDKFKRRRPVIVANFSAVGVLLLFFLLSRSILEVAFLYQVYSFMNSAPSTPINLLIMETQPKARWAASYARYQWLAGAGQAIGLVASSVWSAFLPLSLLVILLSLSSFVGAVMAARLIAEPAFLFEGTALLRHPVAMLRKVVTQPAVFLRSTRPRYLRNAFRIVRSDFTGDLRVLYASILVFYLVTGITSPAFVPILRAKGATDSQVFVASTMNLVVMVVSFRYFGLHMKRNNFVRHSVLALVLRACSFALIGVAAYFVTGYLFYGLAVFFFSLASGVAAGVYYTTSTAMVYDALGTDEQGYSLGIYTALTGVSLTLGSLASGYISFYASYYATYLVIGAGFGLCAWITRMLRSTRFASGSQSLLEK